LLIIFIVYMNYKAGNTANQMLWSVLFILSIFGTVFLHELGHALAARRYGIATRDITLLPIGGLARLERIPEKPSEELVVALAGPAVNLAIAFVTYFFVKFPEVEEVEGLMLLGVSRETFLLNFFVVNIWLSIFNMLPAFPMDGGRVLRAVLSGFMGRLKATHVAARIGQLLALGFILLGFYANPFLIFIGLFILFGAQAELKMVTTTHMLTGGVIGDIVIKNYEQLQTNDSLQLAVSKLLGGTTRSFLVMEDERPVGFLDRDRIIKALASGGKDSSVGAAMAEGILTFDYTTPIAEVFKSMTEKQADLVMVMHENQPVGVVDTGNIMEYIMVKSALAEPA
jgi:Zn-dependent protease/predicted transcriptional regulator